MGAFPSFMRDPANRVAVARQHTRGMEGYAFDGAAGVQMAFRTAVRDAVTSEHIHGFDEWLVVLEGVCVLTLDGEEVRLDAGQELFIPKGMRIGGTVTAGTRTIHAFGGGSSDPA
jgi:quercetin dioxygenase-like cupin family protein